MSDRNYPFGSKNLQTEINDEVDERKNTCPHFDADCEYRTSYGTCGLSDSERADCCPVKEEHVKSRIT